MASESSLGDEGWPKWKLALAVGAPVALGAAGLWLYKRRLSSSAVITSKTAESVVQDATQIPQACYFHIAAHAMCTSPEYLKKSTVLGHWYILGPSKHRTSSYMGITAPHRPFFPAAPAVCEKPIISMGRNFYYQCTGNTRKFACFFTFRPQKT